VRNFFAVAVVAVVFVYYSFPTFTTDGFCNSTTADIGVVLTIASSTSSGSRIIHINCDAGYSLIENTLFLTVAVVATVHWLLRECFWSHSRQFRTVWNLSALCSIIFVWYWLLEDSSLAVPWAPPEQFQWNKPNQIFLGVNAALWSYLLAYELYAIWLMSMLSSASIDLSGVLHAAPEPAQDPLAESSLVAPGRAAHAFTYWAAPSDTLWCFQLFPSMGWLARATRNCCSHVSLIEYSGELDASGRPHGLGRWNDSKATGESMRGFWRHGEPTGPFISTEGV
jgi:hypothetical protein